MSEIEICPSREDLYQRAAALFARLASEAVSSRSRFSVALSGGSTPRGVYGLLAEGSFREQIPWPQLHLFWGDERCVPPGHPESNYRMAEESLLSRVSIPAGQVHRIPTEQGPGKAAGAYERTLRESFNLRTGEWPRFDLVFLGMGPDGHTASLFPGTEGLREDQRLVVAHYVEALKTWRVTLSAPVLNHAAHVVFLVTGADKAATLKEVLHGAHRPERFPAQLIRPVRGALLWLLDQPAAALVDAGHAPR